jgi:hypothetical protein
MSANIIICPVNLHVVAQCTLFSKFNVRGVLEVKYRRIKANRKENDMKSLKQMKQLIMNNLLLLYAKKIILI